MKLYNRYTADSQPSTKPSKRLNGKHRQVNAYGFTLIEVLIGMAIFAIGILAVTTMQMNSINRNAAARMQTESTARVVASVELLLALPYEDAWLDEGSSPYEVQNGSYTIECTIEEDPDNMGLPIKHIQIRVTNPNRNASKPVILTSIKGQGQAAGI